MKIACEFSHLGGAEILEQRYPDIDKEIYEVINNVVGEKNKVSKEKNRKGKLLFSPKAFKAEFKNYFESLNFFDIICFSIRITSKKRENLSPISFLPYFYLVYLKSFSNSSIHS